ncbi:TPA: hypothetical protein ACH3X2_005038 [Trebouxia sp. C0005]
MTSHTYVLLYECESGEFGYESVVLRLLPFNHPFGALLLRKGSRQAAEKRYFERDVWRRYAKKYSPWTPRDKEAYLKGPEPGQRPQPEIHYQAIHYTEELGWRREHVFWSSLYGAPSELHLVLHDSVQAWVAQQQAVNFHSCTFDNPKTLAGALRLDSDERGSESITRDISKRHPATNAAGPIDHDTDSIADQYEAGFECNSAYQPPLLDPDWLNSHQFLRDIVLSCTFDEVEEALAAFYQCQASFQFMKYKDELLQRLTCRTNATGEQ